MRVFLAVVVILWAATTARQVRDWHDEARLWATAVQVAPLKPRPWVNLAHQTYLHGDEPAAVTLFQRAEALSGARPNFERDRTRLIVRHNLDALEYDRTAWRP